MFIQECLIQDDRDSDLESWILRELRRIKEIGVSPDLLIFTSSTEFVTLGTSEGQAALTSMQLVFPGTPIVSVALGCLGFHASLLHFSNSRSSSAIVILFEHPRELQQFMLDSIGMGKEGLVALPGASIVTLQKRIPHSVAGARAVGCWICSGPGGPSGLLDLAHRISEYLQRMCFREDDAIVSFELPIRHSRALLEILSRSLHQSLRPVNWLESSERNGIHRLTLKPLIEMRGYAHEVGGVATILTLGAGGRMGICHVAAVELSDRVFQPEGARCVDIPCQKAMREAIATVEFITRGLNQTAQSMLEAQLHFLRRDGQSENFYYTCQLSNLS